MRRLKSTPYPGLTPLLSRTYQAILSYSAKCGRCPDSPTLRAILGLPAATVLERLKKIEKAGYITRKRWNIFLTCGPTVKPVQGADGAVKILHVPQSMPPDEAMKLGKAIIAAAVKAGAKSDPLENEFLKR